MEGGVIWVKEIREANAERYSEARLVKADRIKKGNPRQKNRSQIQTLKSDLFRKEVSGHLS
jgi:hypothetical protein